jgi:hypothetical protein
MTVLRLKKRLEALEGRCSPLAAYEHMSDEELRLRIAVLDARILDALEAEGVVIPADLAPVGDRKREEWIKARVRELDD